MKMSVVLNFSITSKGQTLEFGGTIDSEGQAAVTGYPDYDPALVPKASASSSGS